MMIASYFAIRRLQRFTHQNNTMLIHAPRSLSTLLFGIFGIFAAPSLVAEDLRLNQIQAIGTHNSYHIAPPQALLQLIRVGSKDAADSIDYTHLPLPEQLGRLRIRQIELDLYYDPEGGIYSNPIGHQATLDAGQDAGDHPNTNGALDQPGMKIIHSPGFDYRTTVPTLVAALRQVRDWSLENPHHIPVLILIELKESVVGPAGVVPVRFGEQGLDAVDAEIRSVFADDQIITPDLVRGKRATLRDAVLQDGWPGLEACLGKVFFALDNEGSIRDLYLKDHPTLENRVMFASVAPEHPAAAFMKLNDPVAGFEKIQHFVTQGFIIRTRADADTRQARSGDTSRREKALQSGAQFISTDYPEPDHRFGDYQVRLPDGGEYRNNPVSRKD
jgi:hypothetical protein